MTKIEFVTGGISIGGKLFPHNTLAFNSVGDLIMISLINNNYLLFSASYREFVNSSNQPYSSAISVISDLLLNNVGITTGSIGFEAFINQFSDLPDPTTVANKIYYVKNSQGTKWLPGSLGGTYYPSGSYYSDGSQWITGISPYQALQVDVDAGMVADQFVSPSTLNNYSGWNKTKVGLSNVDNTSDINKPVSTAQQAALNSVDDDAIAYSLALG